MSWDQQAYSFGNPNAQPPTPTQTPTSAQFPSPTFQTPRNTNSSFENRSGWTPTFAEEYSVFNSTPGRLTTSHHQFVEVSTPIASASDRRLSSTGHIAAELASHVHHLSPNPSAPLPPVDPSSQLSSSPIPYPSVSGRFDDSTKKKVTPKKPRKRLEEAFSGQTATPPQSASKGSRKLAPKLSTETMQNDSHQGQYGINESPTQQHNLIHFPSSGADLFGYPMSAPATAPVFTHTKPFWDPDASMSGMDLDFSTDDSGMFNTGSHRMTNSFDWGRNNQMFQENVNIPSPQPLQQSQQSSGQQQPVKRQRPLAPKVAVPKDMPTALPPFNFNNTPVSDDPFSAATLGSVDPGLLFSRNNPPTMASGFEDVVLPASRPASSHIARQPYEHQMREARREQEELRLARSVREGSFSRRFERGTASSPVKGSARPGLQRSVSDSRAKRYGDRVMPRTGRTSPLKQSRPPGLTPISEGIAPRPRTEVRLTVDKKGRARTETVIIEEQATPAKAERPSSINAGYESSEYESSTDGEQIMIPSRNTSFNLPQQAKGPKLARFETSNRGSAVRRHSISASHSRSESSSQQSTQMDSIESEAETVMEEDDGSGDATRALRKVLESRKKDHLQQRDPRHHRYTSDTQGNAQYIGYSSSTNLSPTTVTDADGATPSSTRSGTTRCVCGNQESEGFMIQCESCDKWLHGQCVNIDRRSLPPVYVCAFCAQTPNMRGGRIRETARNTAHLASSPLAHKSFKSFR